MNPIAQLDEVVALLTKHQIKFKQLLPRTEERERHGTRFRCVTLERLIQLKHAAGRPKDFEAIAELQALLEARRKRGQSTPGN